jgi:hypothetical protein
MKNGDLTFIKGISTLNEDKIVMPEEDEAVLVRSVTQNKHKVIATKSHRL